MKKTLKLSLIAGCAFALCLTLHTGSVNSQPKTVRGSSTKAPEKVVYKKPATVNKTAQQTAASPEKKAAAVKPNTSTKSSASAKKVAQTSKAAPAKRVAQTSKAAPAKRVAQTSKTAPAKRVAQTNKATPARTVAQTNKATPTRTVAQTSKVTPTRTVAQTSKATSTRTVAQTSKTAPAKRVAQTSKAAPTRTVAQTYKVASTRTVAPQTCKAAPAKHQNKSKSSSQVTSRGSSTTSSTRGSQNVVNYAEKFIGNRYVFGGMSPSGFDCSGFTSYVYKSFGINLPRTASGQAGVGQPVSESNLAPGDLVLFETYEKGISHVGIYVGNRQFIDASNKGVGFSNLGDNYYRTRYRGARRILN
jgi:cell wall-associated NlpC family hydrolase